MLLPPDQPNSSPAIFDIALRAQRRDRAAARFTDYDFLYRFALDELFERLAVVQRPLEEVLLIGCPNGEAAARLQSLGKRVTCCDPGSANARTAGGVQADEEALPFADESFDLIFTCGTLDTVNDLPGALVLMRRILRPDGLLLAAMAGAGSLPRLRESLLAGEGDRAGAHIHPQIDLRSAGDLLQRAGFAMPVVDSDVAVARYGSIVGLMNDLRGMGGANVMTRRSPLTRGALARAAEHFASLADPDGKTAEQFSIVYLSAWKPDPSQPKPARRGSGKMSLADALKPKDAE